MRMIVIVLKCNRCVLTCWHFGWSDCGILAILGFQCRDRPGLEACAYKVGFRWSRKAGVQEFDGDITEFIKKHSLAA